MSSTKAPHWLKYWLAAFRSGGIVVGPIEEKAAADLWPRIIDYLAAVREIRHISREPRVWDICDRALTMTDAPERTPLSGRIRWDNCICGKGMQDGDGWDLDTQCAYCDDADEVAALEQERDSYKMHFENTSDQLNRDNMQLGERLDEEMAEVERLRAAIAVKADELEQMAECLDYADEPALRARATELRALTKPEGE